jgi:hypothetical protein
MNFHQPYLIALILYQLSFLADLIVGYLKKFFLFIKIFFF